LVADGDLTVSLLTEITAFVHELAGPANASRFSKLIRMKKTKKNATKHFPANFPSNGKTAMSGPKPGQLSYQKCVIFIF
jgi:hypothetical protein